MLTFNKTYSENNWPKTAQIVTLIEFQWEICIVYRKDLECV